MGNSSSRTKTFRWLAPKGFTETKGLTYVQFAVQNMFRKSFLSDKIRIDAYDVNVKIGDLVYIISHLFICLKNCKSSFEFVDAIYNALSTLLKKTPMELAEIYAKYITNAFSLIFGRAIVAWAQSDGPLKQEPPGFLGFLSDLRSLTSNYNEIITSEFSTKFSTFLACVLTMPIAVKHNISQDWCGFTKQQSACMQKDRNKVHSVTWAVRCLDSCLFMVERLAQSIYARDAKHIFSDDNLTSNYRTDYNWVTFYIDRLDLVDNEFILDENRVPTNRKHDLTSFLSFIEDLIALNKELTACVQDKAIRGTYRANLAALERARLKTLLKLNVKTSRNPPLATAFISSPGVGKTEALEKNFKMIFDIEVSIGVRAEPYSPKTKFNYNHSDPFMAGLSASHQAIVVDDIAQFTRDITIANKGGSATPLVDWINPNPLTTVQADLENKGMIPFRCSVVGLTSNVETCGFENVFIKEGGIWRRILFVFIEVRPEFRVPGETQMLGDLNNPENPDLHIYKIKKYINKAGVNEPVWWHNSTREWKSATCNVGMNITEYAFFLRKEIIIPHHDRIARANRSNQFFQASGICNACGITEVICPCARAQSGSHYDSDDSFRCPSDATISDDDDDEADIEFQIKGADDEPLSELCWRYYSCVQFAYHAILFEVAFKLHFDDFADRRAVHMSKIYHTTLNKHDYDNSRLSAFRNYFGYKYTSFIESKYSKNICTILEEARQNKINILTGCTALVTVLVTFISLMRLMGGFFKTDPKSDDLANSQVDEVVESVPQPPEKVLTKPSRAVMQSDVIEHSANADSWSPNFDDMTRLSGAPSTITKRQLLNVLPRNIIYCLANDGRLEYPINILGIYGNVAILPRHFYLGLKKANFNVTFTLMRHNNRKNIGSSRFNIKIDETSFIDTNSTQLDYVFMKHSAFGTFRDIRKFFLDRHFLGCAKGTVMGRNDEGNIISHDFSGFKTANIWYKHSKENLEYRYVGAVGYLNLPTHNGFCGAPYVVETNNGCFIGGMHVAYRFFKNLHEGCICPIFTSMLNIKTKGLVPLSYNGLVLNDTFSTTQHLAVTQSIHKLSPIRRLNNCSLFVYGDLNTHRSKPSTNVVPTLMSEEILLHYDKLDFTHFSPKGVNSKTCIKNTVQKMCKKSAFPPLMVHECSDALYTMFSNSIKKFRIKLPNKSHSISAAINGIDGVPYVDRLDVKTSGGFAHKGRKDKQFIVLPSTDEHQVHYGINDDITSEIEKALVRVSRGERILPIWDFNFKDEPISAEKVRKDKVRIFNSAPLFFTILERKVFLWCIPIFTGKFRHFFGSAIGANAIGEDWTTLYKHITRFGVDRIFAGDYASFDKGMEAALICAAFDILIRLAEDAGFPEHDLAIMRAIATEVAYPVTNVFGTVLEFFGTNPSGHSLTTIINTIVNILYMMIACKEIESSGNYDIAIDYESFFDYISLCTYGDDNISSSKLDHINHTSISNALAKYGIVYTMADKISESVPFIHISEATFLKRYFVPSTYVEGVIAAPLEEASLIKSLSICTQSQSISFEQQCAEIIDSACREYFQYGETIFRAKRQFLISILDRYQLRPYISKLDLPTFEHLYENRFPAIMQSEAHSWSSSSSTDPEDYDYFEYDCGCFIEMHGRAIHRESSCDECHCDDLIDYCSPVCLVFSTPDICLTNGCSHC